MTAGTDVEGLRAADLGCLEVDAARERILAIRGTGGEPEHDEGAVASFAAILWTVALVMSPVRCWAGSGSNPTRLAARKSSSSFAEYFVRSGAIHDIQPTIKGLL